MPSSPLLFVHICGAVIGIFAGFFAMFVRKGSGLHNAAGTVFFVAMIAMTTSAAYFAAFIKPIFINVVVAVLTFYLVVTAWRAAKNRKGAVTIVDYAAFSIALVNGLASVTYGITKDPAAPTHGVPTPMYFVFGSVALLFAAGDVRMFVRGGATGTRRIARHLWRMSMALLITTLSAYPGRPAIFPLWLRKTNFLYIPSVLLVGSMLFWLYRVSRRKRLPSHAPPAALTSLQSDPTFP
jgi:uncharacterized membrane protein